MAAETVAAAGHKVVVAEQKTSVGRKFLMAGKSGLNLTMQQDFGAFAEAYHSGHHWLAPLLHEFGPDEVVIWANELGQETFAGSSGRVFPVSMKASPLLRAWLGRLTSHGVDIRTGWKWRGWDGDGLQFETPTGPSVVRPDATIMALGGGSWSRLGSDGAWMEYFRGRQIQTADFGPSNVGIEVEWSDYMRPFFGQPLKNVSWQVGQHRSRGEAVLTNKGIEGGGIYSITPGLRASNPLRVDLMPDWTVKDVWGRLETMKRKDTVANKLRKGLSLSKMKIALLQEFCRPLPTSSEALAKQVKELAIPARLGDLDEAISTTGGVLLSACNEDLMLTDVPGTFVAGEMLDWDAPTGGYLITACLASGRRAGQGAVDWLAD